MEVFIEPFNFSFFSVTGWGINLDYRDIESGQRPKVPGCNGAGIAKRSYPASKARGGGWEELPCF